MVQCVSCSDEFDTERGMKMHHSMVHGESIAGQLVSCDYCGESFRQRANRTEGNNFCDDSCFYNWFSENKVGDNNAKWERVEVPCETCGQNMYLQPNRVNRSENNFCSQPCFAEWRSENVVGENHHQWKEDSDGISYGSGWHEHRKRVRELDNHTCQACGLSGDESEMRLDVHHIRPVRTFDSPEKAHYDGNMVLLCRSCHREFEPMDSEKQVSELGLDRF